jgi:hypothetical protein
LTKRKFAILKSSKIYPRHICIDVGVADEILKLLLQNPKYKDKYEYITGRILEQPNIYFDLYERIENDKGVKVSEMRFFPNGDNCRVYCREITINENIFCVIMAKLLPKKKPQKINKAIKQFIDALKQYDYELEE